MDAKMKYLLKFKHRKWTFELGYGTQTAWRRDKYNSFAAKDTYKERYRIYFNLD
jgi:hypothetical protein